MWTEICDISRSLEKSHISYYEVSEIQAIFYEKSIYYLYLIFLTEILITQCQGKSLSIEEELATAMGFQQLSIQNASYNTIQGRNDPLKTRVD